MSNLDADPVTDPPATLEPSSPPEAARQLTGDRAVDEGLEQIDAVTDQPLDTQLEVGERVLRVLQGRLADLGQE